jgi:hypothetical protein
MRLIPVINTPESLKASFPLWAPFLPSIAQHTKQSVKGLIAQVAKREVRLTLVWDDETNKAAALVGVRFHMREADLIAEIVWTAGHDHKAWIHLLPELEAMLRQAGAVECRPICRPGWRKVLEAHGYRLTHLQMEKPLNG